MFYRYRRTIVVLAMAVASAGGGMIPAQAAKAAAFVSTYDQAVLADGPSAYWPMSQAQTGLEPDLAGSNLTGQYVSSPSSTTLPNGEIAAVFDGATQYMQVADNAALSPATAGVLTVEAWMRPDTLTSPHTESSGYVHWMGKGETGNHEYVSRMYSADNTDGRANRISGYLFNSTGGLGAGSYFQDVVTAGQWIHYVLVINANAKDTAYPDGYTKLYKNGVLRDQDDLNVAGTPIVPTRGNAPFRVGTRDLNSFFEGAVGKVAIYTKELTPTQISNHYAAMSQVT